jgi:hypothetical protein
LTDGGAIAAGNYTFNADSGVLTNASAIVWADINITYTYIPYTIYENTFTDLSNNMSQGVEEISHKLPTVLLLGAIVLLMGVLVILWRQSQAMGIGGGNTSL